MYILLSKDSDDVYIELFETKEEFIKSLNEDSLSILSFQDIEQIKEYGLFQSDRCLAINGEIVVPKVYTEKREYSLEES